MSIEGTVCPVKVILRKNGVAVDTILCDGPKNCLVDASFSPGLPALVKLEKGVEVRGSENPLQAGVYLVTSCVKKTD